MSCQIYTSSSSLNLNSPLLAARDEFKLEVKILIKEKVRC
jgi:hypothetical protein